jgi:SHAQKYF class myb-like DNA-binding protein
MTYLPPNASSIITQQQIRSTLSRQQQQQQQQQIPTSPETNKRKIKRQKRAISPSTSTSPALGAASKDFVFKDFSFASNKVRFVNTTHLKEGINDGSWSETEHNAFLLGLKECGKGKWRDIAEKYVKTRTRTQVASHAQKYFQRKGKSTPPSSDKEPLPSSSSISNEAQESSSSFDLSPKIAHSKNNSGSRNGSSDSSFSINSDSEEDEK